MLTREENNILCQTDKGTPMGEFCRRILDAGAAL